MRRILAACFPTGSSAASSGSTASASTALPLLNWPGTDPVFTRGQAFHGRAAAAVAVVLSAIGARGVLVPAGLQVIPAGGTFEEKAFVLDNHDGPWIMESRTVKV